VYRAGCKFFHPSTTEQGYEFCASPMCRGEPPTGERRECCNCFDLVHVSCYFQFEELNAQGLDEEGVFDFHGKSCYFCTETLGVGVVRISPSPADVAVGCTGRPAESVQRGSFHVRPAEVVEVEGTPPRFCCSNMMCAGIALPVPAANVVQCGACRSWRCTSGQCCEELPDGAHGHNPRCLLCVPVQSADGENIDGVDFGSLSVLQFPFV
jgi:hypothetical protein